MTSLHSKKDRFLNKINGYAITLIVIAVAFTLIINIWAGLVSLLLSLVFRKPIHKFIESKCRIPVWISKLSSFCLIVSIAIIAIHNLYLEEERLEQQQKEAITQEFLANKNNIIKEIEDLISNNKLQNAQEIVHKYLVSGDAELLALNKNITGKLNATREKELLAELASLSDTQLWSKLQAYKELTSLQPQNTTYQEKLAEYKKKYDAYEKREKLIKQQFRYDGSNRYLTKFIKNNMRDPDSYEHIKTTYRDTGGDYIVVETQYRGRNAFNGMVVESIKMKVNINNGAIIPIID